MYIKYVHTHDLMVSMSFLVLCLNPKPLVPQQAGTTQNPQENLSTPADRSTQNPQENL